ncbi:hypothetical protein QYE76_041723 [Lolium multiflorum]|uniref:Uncharacterized protein n=1 Tax=Lolium multiflorum TaxID=4521 RepID=A0AAD8TE39_LOLMU|nr:hypothetical protein QYE76_041723 [Lolium multiflorum]
MLGNLSNRTVSLKNDVQALQEGTKIVETQLGKIAESQTIILARFADKPEPNPVEDLKMIRIERSVEALEELDYSNAPIPEYSVEDLIKTIMARGDFTRLNDEDMMVLAKAVFPERNLRPNLGAILVLYLNHQALEARGPICGGGVITVLARRLNIDVSNLQALEGPRRLGSITLNACGMIRKVDGRYYFNIPGADHLIAAPLPNGLFSLVERRLHYDAHVEANLPPQQDEPEEGEEVEQEPQGPEQEQQPLHDFTTYQDLYALEGSIENLSNLAINLRDHTTELSSQFTHWSSQWNSWNYPPPQ